MTNNKQPERKSRMTLGFWSIFGVIIGAGIGMAIDNMGAGVGAGLVIGIGIGLALRKQSE